MATKKAAKAVKKSKKSPKKPAIPSANKPKAAGKPKSDPFTPEDLIAIAEALTARLGAKKAKLVIKLLHDAGATPPPPSKPA